MSCTFAAVPSTVYQPGFGVYADLRFHAEIPLIAFLGRVHLGIAHAARVLGRAERSNQRGINDRTRFEQQTLAASAPH
jgi:hypothetical protein